MAGLAQYVQKAVMAALLADEGVCVAVSGVYDAAPAQTAYPYILVGVTEDGKIAADEAHIHEILLVVQIIIREPDRFSIFDLANKVRETTENLTALEAGCLVAVRPMKTSLKKSGSQGSYAISMPFRFVVQEDV